jgi:hypothetical protein
MSRIKRQTTEDRPLISDLKDLPVDMAIGCFSVFEVVVLMIEFRGPEFARRCEFGFHIVILLFECRDELGGGFFLLIIQIENSRTVLLAHIRPLAIQLGEIMRLEEQPGQLLVARFRRIVDHLDRFGMARLIRADLFVGRIINMPARVAHRR